MPTPPESVELDPQAALVADSFVLIVAVYIELAERLHQLDELGLATTEELEQVRADASALTARAAQLMKEVRTGLHEHEGHGCGHEDAYDDLADFLSVLLESGAGLLELRDLEQIDKYAVDHPFLHLAPILDGETYNWLQIHSDEENQQSLASFAELLDALLPNRDVNVFLRLLFGPVPLSTLEGLRSWYQSSLESPDELASVLVSHLLELDEDEGGPRRLRRLGEHSEGVVLLEGDFDNIEILPLLGELEERSIPYRIESEGSLSPPSTPASPSGRLEWPFRCNDGHSRPARTPTGH
jgi:hypothetical protein